MDFFMKRELTNKDVIIVGIVCFLVVAGIYSYTSVEDVRDTVLDFYDITGAFLGLPSESVDNVVVGASSDQPLEQTPESFEAAVTFGVDQNILIDAIYKETESVAKSIYGDEFEPLPKFSPVYTVVDQPILLSPRREEDKIVVEGQVGLDDPDYFTLSAAVVGGRPQVLIDVEGV